MGYIYLLIDRRNGKKYVGKHNGSKKNYWSSGIIPNKICKKYGKEVFDKIIVENDVPNHLLNEKEIFYINKYDSFNNGYNLSIGGDGGGEWIYKKTIEEKIKISNIKSKKLKNRVFSDETKRKMSESAKNKIMTDEHKENIRKAVILRGGHPHSDETKKKLSILKIGVKNPKHSNFMKENNPKSQKISIKGVIYKTIKEACLMLNLSRSSIKYKLNSKTDKFKDWFRID
jgi:group I intron endonuclease